jgi:hypothetical protein
MTPEQLPDTEPVFFPCGVADPERRAGYVADGGGIVAVGLRDGRRLWRTDRAERPLISDGERLVAATHQRAGGALRVVVLDGSRQGEPVLVSDPVVLQEWVRTATGRPERFCTNARAVGNRLQLQWEAHARYRGGAAPPAHVRREAARDAVGVVEIDLESGAVATLEVDHDTSVRTSPRRPPLHTDDLEGPWLAGGAVARLVWGIDAGEQVLALETTDPSTEDAGATVELARGQGLVAQVTPDGRYLLVHEEPSPRGDGRWLAFSVETGRRVATLTHDAGASAPAILGDRAYYLVERSEEGTRTRALRARELESNSLVWELPLAARRTSAAPRLRQ